MAYSRKPEVNYLSESSRSINTSERELEDELLQSQLQASRNQLPLPFSRSEILANDQLSDGRVRSSAEVSDA